MTGKKPRHCSNSKKCYLYSGTGVLYASGAGRSLKKKDRTGDTVKTSAFFRVPMGAGRRHMVTGNTVTVPSKAVKKKEEGNVGSVAVVTAN